MAGYSDRMQDPGKSRFANSSREDPQNSQGCWAVLALDLQSNGYIFVDTDHFVRGANRAAHDLLDKPAGSLVHKPSQQAIGLTHGTADGDPVPINQQLDRVAAERQPVSFQAVAPGSRTESGRSSVNVTITPLVNKREYRGAIIELISPDSGEGTHHQRLVESTVSLVSHELRAPLLHIKGFISSLLEEDVQWDLESQKDFLRTADREADRLSAIVNALLEISRLGNADPQVDLESIDPRLLAYTGVDDASPFLSRFQVDVNVQEGLPAIQVDWTRMISVFVNLLENAAKHSPEGSRIVVSAELQDGYVVFCVRDEGSGISPEIRDRIFEMFFRGPSPKNRLRSAHSQGSGLGLAVCRSVVEAHGGRIWLDTSAGPGATFRFSVPTSDGCK